MADGIKIGDAQTVGHQAAGGRPPAGSYRHAGFFGVGYEIGNYQKVARIFHFLNHRYFIFETLAIHGLIYL